MSGVQHRGAIVEWDVEQNEFWRSRGSKIAFRNLLISIPCLLFAFAIWLYWSIIIVQMENLGFSFTKTQLYTLPAIAGLAGDVASGDNNATAGMQCHAANSTAMLNDRRKRARFFREAERAPIEHIAEQQSPAGIPYRSLDQSISRRQRFHNQTPAELIRLP